MRVAGKVSVILLAARAASSVDVVKDTVAVAVVLTARVNFNAVFTSAVTPPTIGVLTWATRVVDVEVSILRPVVPPTVAVTAASAPSVSPVHVTVTDPAARSEVTVNVILSVVYAEVETTEAGEVMPHRLMACAVTRPAGKDSVILLADAALVNGVVVLNVTEAVLSAPVALPIFSAFNSAVTPPTIGVLIKAGIVSMEVSIFKPVFPAAVAATAADASTVSAVQVTVTSPAESVEKGARVKVILSDSNFDVVVVF